MRIVITGASGFIGRALCESFHDESKVVALSRDARRAAKSLGGLAQIIEWDGRTAGDWSAMGKEDFCVINLAGENVASGRWSQSKKSSIFHSRSDCSRAVLESIRRATYKPKVVFLASAVGFYGSRGNEQLDEGSDKGKGFLSDVCLKAESFAEEIERLGVRCVVLRSAMVLGRNGGALPRFIKLFKYGLGGPMGIRRRWMSWISLADEISAIKFLIEHDDLRGVFNLTAPEPVTNWQFSRVLGKVMKRPYWFACPGFMLRLIVGEMANEMLLSSQKVVPKRLLDAGFEFKHPDLESALKDIMSNS